MCLLRFLRGGVGVIVYRGEELGILRLFFNFIFYKFFLFRFSYSFFDVFIKYKLRE